MILWILNFGDAGRWCWYFDGKKVSVAQIDGIFIVVFLNAVARLSRIIFATIGAPSRTPRSNRPLSCPQFAWFFKGILTGFIADLVLGIAPDS